MELSDRLTEIIGEKESEGKTLIGDIIEIRIPESTFQGEVRERLRKALESNAPKDAKFWSHVGGFSTKGDPNGVYIHRYRIQYYK